MKVKICGLCRPEDALTAAHAGADYIGVILARAGQRSQTPAAAAAIYAQGGAGGRVGVFMNQELEEVCALAQSLSLDVVQLHGRENAAFARAVAQRTGCAVWKTAWLHGPADLDETIATYGRHIDGLLLDARGENHGGTGTTFDWTLATNARIVIPAHLTLIVAGGLNPTNVRKAIAAMDPDIVDVASGVERGVGEKSPAAVQAFVRNAKS